MPCRGGPLILAMLLAGTAAVAQEPAEISVLTWNIRDISGGYHAQKRRKAAMEAAEGVDIILLQEQWHTAVPAIERITQTYGYQACTVDKYKTGLMTLVPNDWVIQSCESFAFKDQVAKGERHCSSYDCIKPKGVQITRALLPDGTQVGILNTHMQATHTKKKQAAMARDVRVNQLPTLELGLQTLRDAGPMDLLIAGGDFNVIECYDDSPECETPLLTERMAPLQDALRVLQPWEREPAYTYVPTDNPMIGHKDPPERLDYIFFHSESGWTPNRAEVMRGEMSTGVGIVSDHYAEISVFRAPIAD